MDVPQGFIEAPIPAEDTDFDDPTKSAPLAVFTSSVAVAVIVVAARPAYADGTVLDWLRFLSSHFEIDLQHVIIRPVGKAPGQPGVTAFGVQYQDGTKINLMLVAFEDGGRFVTAHGLCPAELWPSYGQALSASVESITLERPKGPTHAIDDSESRARSFAATKSKAADALRSQDESAKDDRDVATGSGLSTGAETSPVSPRSRAKGKMVEAIAEARRHLADDAFDEAERAILSIDSDIQGAVKVAALYEEHLRRLVGSGGKPRDAARAERVFRRALSWAQSCYPEPHTQCESDNYEAGRREDRAKLVTILGSDPDASTDPDPCRSRDT